MFMSSVKMIKVNLHKIHLELVMCISVLQPVGLSFQFYFSHQKALIKAEIALDYLSNRKRRYS